LIVRLLSGLNARASLTILLMDKKNIFLVGIVVVLAAVYVVYFTDWFRPKVIQISHIYRTARVTRAARGARAARNVPAPQDAAVTQRLIFGLGQNYLLKEVKVVPLAALLTNKFALPVWHLVTSSNSVPLHLFLYGQGIRGMRPAAAGSRPEPIQPGVTYRLFVTATKGRGQQDFQIDAAPAATGAGR
jgi:hypothetical protein